MKYLCLFLLSFTCAVASYGQQPWHIDTTFSISFGIHNTGFNIRQGGPTGLYIFGMIDTINGSPVGNAANLSRSGQVVGSKTYPPVYNQWIVGNLEFTQSRIGMQEYAFKAVNGVVDSTYSTEGRGTPNCIFNAFPNGESISFGQTRPYGGRQNNLYWCRADGTVDSSRTRFSIQGAVIPIHTDRKGNILARVLQSGNEYDLALIRIHPNGQIDSIAWNDNYYASYVGDSYTAYDYTPSVPYTTGISCVAENSDGSYTLTGLFCYVYSYSPMYIPVYSPISRLDSAFRIMPDRLPHNSPFMGWADDRILAAMPDDGGAIVEIGYRSIPSVSNSTFFLNPDLSLDSIAPVLHPNGTYMEALATHRDTVYVYGDFTTLGPGMERNRIARFVRNSTITSASKSSLVLQSISVRPNPAQGAFTVSLPDASTGSSIRIMNMAGQQVMDFPTQKQASLLVAGLMPGMYIITSPGFRPVKVVVQ